MKTEDPNVRVLVVGSGSMLGSALLARKSASLILSGIANTELGSVDFSDYDVIINMAYDPRYMLANYDPKLDFDLKVAALAARAKRHFVMLSSRKIYGLAHQWPLTEDAPKAPGDCYGRNKLETEGRVQALLGSSCTILRLANVFDFELQRRTFFGMALTSLRQDGRIVLDSNPLVKKDFIPLSDCVESVSAVLRQIPTGIFNLGYGTATEIGDIAQWLIEGYGQGEVVVTSAEMRDEFLLDISRLTAMLGSPAHQMSIREHCLEIGERLQHA